MIRIARQHCPEAQVMKKEGATWIDAALLAFYIARKTDDERDRLCLDTSLLQELRHALLDVGYPPSSVPFVRFFIESQETVNRDYGGNWHEAMEMP
jgi:hypothetical protein